MKTTKRETNAPLENHVDQADPQPQEPGPTSGGMGSMGSGTNEPSLEEKLGMPPKAKGDTTHTDRASNDVDDSFGRNDATGSDAVDTTAPQAPNNFGSSARDMDQERGGGMSGGLG